MGQRENICPTEDEEEKVGGALTLGEHLAFSDTSDGNVQRATVHFIITTLIPFISLIGSLATSWLSRKKNYQERKRGISLI